MGSHGLLPGTAWEGPSDLRGEKEHKRRAAGQSPVGPAGREGGSPLRAQVTAPDSLQRGVLLGTAMEGPALKPEQPRTDQASVSKPCWYSSPSPGSLYLCRNVPRLAISFEITDQEGLRDHSFHFCTAGGTGLSCPLMYQGGPPLARSTLLRSLLPQPHRVLMGRLSSVFFTHTHFRDSLPREM